MGLLLTTGLLSAACHSAPDELPLLAGDVQPGDRFGHATAMSSDFALVGAPGHDGIGEESGAAYVFASQSSGQSWVHQEKLSPQTLESGDQFGSAVDIVNDHAVVGAYLDDEGGELIGAVYVFKHIGDAWIEQVKLQPDSARTFDYFGFSVATAGDYIAVGAPGDDEAGSNAGAVYVFHQEGTDWAYQSKIIGARADAGFGLALDLDGDYLLVGAYQDQHEPFISGAAYVFKRTGTDWIQQARLAAAPPQANDEFGYAVSIQGPTAVIGAPGHSTGTEIPGAVYVFEHNGSTWAQSALLLETSAQAGFRFGRTVSTYGNVVLVGTHPADDNPNLSGTVHLFDKGDSGSWNERNLLRVEDAQSSPPDGYAFSVSLYGNRALITAPLEQAETGSVFLIRID